MKQSSKIVALLLTVFVFTLVPCGSESLSDTAAPLIERKLGVVVTAHGFLFPYDYVNSTVGHAFTLQSAVGDIDQDGHLDVVLPMMKPVHTEDGSVVGAEGEVVIAFGDGTGAFERFARVYAGDPVGSLILEDFDADGWPDILFFGSIENKAGVHEATAFILFGDSEGDFARQNSWPLQGEALGFLTGDVNKDGNPDILYLYQTQEEGLQGIVTQLGDGTGEFSEQGVTIGDNGITTIDACRCLVDLDNDGFLDVVAVGGSVLTPTALWVAYGTPTGEYDFVWIYRDDQRLPMALGTGDFDGDGLLDVAIAYPWNVTASLDYYEETGQSSSLPELGRVLVLYNDGNSGWVEQELDSGVQALSMITGDLSEDGLQDILVFGRKGNGGIFKGADEGLPDVASVYSCLTSAGIATVFLGDFTENGFVDLGVQSTVGTLVIREGDGRGGLQPGWFSPPIDSAVPFGRELDETVADFDGDGHLDLVFYHDYVGVGLIWGDGTGRFDDAGWLFESPDDNIEDVAVGDFNGDGFPDITIAVETYGDGTRCHIWLLRGTGQRYFQAENKPTLATEDPLRKLVPTHVNQDDYLDIVVIPVGNDPFILFGNTNAQFDVGPRFEFPYEGYFSVSNPQVGDFDNNGVPDVLAQARYDAIHEFSILWLGNELGEYTPADYLPALYLSGVADVDGDGYLDFAGSEKDGDGNWVFFGDGSGGFEKQDSTMFTRLLADLNRDGHVDGVGGHTSVIGIELGTATGNKSALGMFANQGHPAFGATLGAIGDFDEDGWLDLAIVNGRHISVLLNRLKEDE